MILVPAREAGLHPPVFLIVAGGRPVDRCRHKTVYSAAAALLAASAGKIRRETQLAGGMRGRCRIGLAILL